MLPVTTNQIRLQRFLDWCISSRSKFLRKYGYKIPESYRMVPQGWILEASWTSVPPLSRGDLTKCDGQMACSLKHGGCPSHFVRTKGQHHVYPEWLWITADIPLFSSTNEWETCTITFPNIWCKKTHNTHTHTHYITSLSYSCNSEPVLKYPSSHETRPWHIISPSMSGTFRLRKTISPKRLRNAPELSLHGSMAWRRNLQPKTKSICFKWQWVKQFFW